MIHRDHQWSAMITNHYLWLCMIRHGRAMGLVPKLFLGHEPRTKNVTLRRRHHWTDLCSFPLWFSCYWCLSLLMIYRTHQWSAMIINHHLWLCMIRHGRAMGVVPKRVWAMDLVRKMFPFEEDITGLICVRFHCASPVIDAGYCLWSTGAIDDQQWSAIIIYACAWSGMAGPWASYQNCFWAMDLVRKMFPSEEDMTGPICVRFNCDCLIIDAHPLNAVHWSLGKTVQKKRISLVGQLAELHTESFPRFSRWFFNRVRVPFIGRLGKLYKQNGFRELDNSRSCTHSFTQIKRSNNLISSTVLLTEE